MIALGIIKSSRHWACFPFQRRGSRGGNPGMLRWLSAGAAFTECLRTPGSEDPTSVLKSEKRRGNDGPEGKFLVRFPLGLSLRDGYWQMIYSTSAALPAPPVGNDYFWWLVVVASQALRLEEVHLEWGWCKEGRSVSIFHAEGRKKLNVSRYKCDDWLLVVKCTPVQDGVRDRPSIFALTRAVRAPGHPVPAGLWELSQTWACRGGKASVGPGPSDPHRSHLGILAQHFNRVFMLIFYLEQYCNFPSDFSHGNSRVHERWIQIFQGFFIARDSSEHMATIRSWKENQYS